MSLINKVLKDLEAQRDLSRDEPSRSPLADPALRSVSPVAPRFSRTVLLRIGLGIALVVSGVYAWIAWNKFTTGAHKPPAVKTAAKSAPASEPPVAVPPPAPAVAPAPLEAPLKKIDVVAPATVPAPVTSPVSAPAPAKPASDTVVRKAVPEPVAKAAAPGKDTNTVLAPPDAGSRSAPASAKPSADLEEDEEAPAKPKPSVDPAPGKVEKKLKALTPEERAESEFQAAVAALQRKRSGEAESRLRTALAAQATHVKSRELLAGLLLQSGRRREAQAALEQGVEANPGHLPFTQLLARSYVESGQDKRALELLEKSRASAVNEAEYLALLATLYQRAGRQDEAIRAFADALNLRPQEGRWWVGLGISLESTEQWKTAADAYRRAAASPNLDKSLQQYAQQRLAIVKAR